MNLNNTTLQGILSAGALICIVAGIFKLFTPEINDFLYNRLFYILIGASFFLQAPTLANTKLLYPMYAAAVLCVIGALLPADSRISVIKTIGLFAGVLISLFSRPRMQKNS